MDQRKRLAALLENNNPDAIKRAAEALDDYGRNGDTLVAHISPSEAALLKALGGSGTVNPHTGLLEFFEGSTAADSHGSNSDGYSGADHGGHGHGGGGSSGGDYGGRDEGERALAAAQAAAPGQGLFADATYDTHGYGPATLAGGRMLGAPGAWVGRQIDKAVANPISTLANLAFGAVPVLGAVNTAMGVAGLPTVGSVGTGFARAATNFGGPASPTAAPSPAMGNPVAMAEAGYREQETERTETGDGGYALDGTGPSGSPESPLASALLGRLTPQPKAMSFGPHVSSYSPTGKQYVTPWGYR